MNSVTRSIKHTLAIIAMLFCIICLPLMVQNAYADDGDIANGDYWRITSDYELVIGVEGKSTSVSLYNTNYPWEEYKHQIKKISFCGNVQAIAGYSGGDPEFYMEKDQISLFFKCMNVEEIDLKGLDTSNVKTMHALFLGCNKLTSVDLTGLDTSNVIFMSRMFALCESLKSIDLTGIDTSNVNYMNSMFCDCSNLPSINLTGLDTSNVTSMGSMFMGCSSLTSLDLTDLDTSNVTNMSSMIRDCSNLTSIEISRLDTSRLDALMLAIIL